MDLPNDWTALLALVFVFGAKHGLDADHLAAIDGLTRRNLRLAPARARWCGTLFSLGHGIVVMIVAVGVGIASAQWQVPPWMENVGAWISIGFLTLLGLLNLQAVFLTPSDAVMAPLGLKAGLLARLQSASHPVAVAAVGALFALSFDTMSQATFFALTAIRHGGVSHALILGMAFTSGMLVVDGVNGLWIARLLRRADHRARIASRIMGLMVALISLSVAAFGLLRWLRADIAAWVEGRELGLGFGVVMLLSASYFLAQALTRPPIAANASN